MRKPAAVTTQNAPDTAAERAGPFLLRLGGGGRRKALPRSLKPTMGPTVFSRLARPRVVLLGIPLIAFGCGLGLEATSTLPAARTINEPDATVRDGSGTDFNVSADAGSTEDAAPGDASSRDAAEVCPAVCAEAGVGTCDPAGTCAITCTGAGTCAGPVVCPPGVPCTVTCTGADSCASTIDCSRASSCSITCIGADACKDRIACSGSACNVGCNAADTCKGEIACDAGTCAIQCTHPDSCKMPISCSGKTCAIDCSGPRSCVRPVSCSGTSCNVSCTGAPTSCAGGVCCDAGACLGNPPVCQ